MRRSQETLSIYRRIGSFAGARSDHGFRPQGRKRRIGNSVRPGKAGQREWEDTMPSGNFVRRPAGAKPVRLRGSPPKPVASLAPASEMGPAKRRHASVWAMGHAAPKPLIFPDAQGAELPEGENDLSVRWARRGPYPAGCATMARTQRTVQAPGRPSPRLDPSRSCGEPVTRLRRTTRWRAHVSSASKAQNKRLQRGRPHARGTRAVAEGGREPEGCIGATTSGNRVIPGPD